MTQANKVRYFEVEQDASDGLMPATESRYAELLLSGKGQVSVKSASETHHIAGSRYLNRAMGYVVLEKGVAIVNALGQTVRTYAEPEWFEGSVYQAPSAYEDRGLSVLE